MMMPLTEAERAELRKPKPPPRKERRQAAKAQKKKLKKNRRRTQKKVVKFDSLKQINHDAAGLDIGASEIYTRVPEGRDVKNVESLLSPGVRHVRVAVSDPAS